MTEAAANRETPLFDVDDVHRHFHIKRGWYGRDNVVLKAVDGVSFSVRTSETLAVVGESGCGKSTLARVIVGLQQPTSGHVRLSGHDIGTWNRNDRLTARKRLQLIFQDPYSSLNPRMTVESTLDEPLRIHGLGNASWRAGRVRELLEIVGLSPAHARRYPHQFSGGQRQRIGIARALAVEPDLIVCDEPVSALDVSVQAQIINLLLRTQRQFALTYIFIAHDLAVVKHIADRVAVMYLGKIVELAGKHEFFSAPRHPYTRALLSAVPRPHPRIEIDRMVLNDEVPSPMNIPAGCRFHTRCPYAEERCRAEEPVLAGGTHRVACHFWQDVMHDASSGALEEAMAAKRNAYVSNLIERFHAEGNTTPAS
jgi:oligopeptide transport system ATP-binding protein